MRPPTRAQLVREQHRKNPPGRPANSLWWQRSNLTPFQVRVAAEMLIDQDPAGVAGRLNVERECIDEILAKPAVRAAYHALAAARQCTTGIYAEEVLRRWWLLGTADMRELVQVRRVACRYCWGHDHRYQYRDTELLEEQQRHRIEQERLSEDRRRPFDDCGGDGYDGGREPCRGSLWVERAAKMGVQDPQANSDHNCPQCDGDGETSVWLADSRTYSPAAAVLYDGIEVTADGKMKIKSRDRDAALLRVAQHLGMIVQRRAVFTLDPAQLSNDQLQDVIQQFSVRAGEQPGPRLLESAQGGAAPPVYRVEHVIVDPAAPEQTEEVSTAAGPS